MELNEINMALKDIGLPYADRRLNVFEVEAVRLEAGVLHLRGRVLEETNRQVLVDGLGKRFPDLEVDSQEVVVGRKSPPRLLSVETNLTSVHDGTSFLAEMVTQMLNGTVVEVLWEQGNWCFVRQMDGYLGWTYRPYLTDALAPLPTHVVIEPVGLLRAAPDPAAALLTRVLGGTGAAVSAGGGKPPYDAAGRGGNVSGGWALLDLAGGWRGWLPADGLRALDSFPQEAGPRQEQVAADACRMIGVPYLWGGCTANGIDCSGFAQLLHRWIGIPIPRDADMQCDAGRPVEPPFAPGDLLFFGEKGEQRRVTHVAVSLGGWQVIHSSRRRNGVQVDDVQAVPGLRDSYLCAATYIGR